MKILQTKQKTMKLQPYCIKRYSSILMVIGVLLFTGKTLTAQDDDAVERNNNEDDTVHLAPEEEPKFPGGEKGLIRYIQNEVSYPDEAKKEGAEGTVVVNFVVDQEGKIEETEIAKSVSDLLDQEALRVVRNMPEWQPGRQRGDKVQVRMNLPIRFALQDDDKDQN